MLRVRFAPSPTGFLHVGSARTFIFNWLYARHKGGTMVLRLDDTDVERNTEASVNSIFEGLRWLDLGWDEEYKQSERLGLHQQIAEAIFQKGMAYRDFTPAHIGDSERSGATQDLALQPWNAGAVTGRERPPGGRRRAVCAPLPRASRARENRFGSRMRFTESRQGCGRHRRLRPAAVRRYADLSLGVLRRRRGSAHQPYYSRARSSFEYLQACADLRGGWWAGSAVRASSAAGRARWIEALQAEAWAGGECDDVSGCGIFAGRHSSTFCACWDGLRKTIAKK